MSTAPAIQLRNAPRFTLLSDQQVEDMPPPPSLVGDKLHRGSLAVLVGPPATGKSFLALGWAASVASGVPAYGDDVHRGPVVYVAAEGSGGLGIRLSAWKARNRITGGIGAHFITHPVNLVSAVEVQGFLNTLQALPEPPALVVFDTLNRCLIGDENSTQDMSSFIAGADRVRTETGATVLILHHMNAQGVRERGNTALRGACDTLLFLKKQGDRVALTCEKQKDGPLFDKTWFRILSVDESAVLVTAKGGLQLQSEELSDIQGEVLALLQTHFPEEGATSTRWKKTSIENGGNESTFHYSVNQLVARGYVVKPEQKRGGKYTLTDEGKAWLTANCKVTANSLQCSSPKSLQSGGGGLDNPPPCSNGEVLQPALPPEEELFP